MSQKSLANTLKKSQNKEKQQLKILNELVVFISAKFDEFEADHKKTEELKNDFEEKAQCLTKNIDKLTSLVDRHKRYFMINCILPHIFKENQN